MPKPEIKSTISELNLSYKLFSCPQKLEYILSKVQEAYPPCSAPEEIMTLEEPIVEEELEVQETAQSQTAALAAPVPTPKAAPPPPPPVEAEEEDPDAPPKKVKKEPVLFLKSNEKDTEKWNQICYILFQKQLFEQQNSVQMESIEIMDKLKSWVTKFYIQDKFSTEFFDYVMERSKIGLKVDIGNKRNLSAIKVEFQGQI